MSFFSRDVPVLSWLSTSTDQANFRSLSVFRILLGLFLLSDYFIAIQPDYDAFFTNTGVLPVQLWRQLYTSPGIFSILSWSNAPIYHDLIQIIYVAALLMFTFGYRTRLANFIIAVIYISIFWRNTFLVCNVEILARCLTVLCLFLPLNRYWSVDAALETQNRRRPYPLIPLVGIKFQISMIYLFAGLFKLSNYDATPTDWQKGLAIWQALHDNFMNNPWGFSLANNFPIMTVIGTHLVPIFQIAFVFLVYSPWYNNVTRLFAILGAIALHASFILFMNVGMFPHLCLVYLVLLMPDYWWDGIFSKRHKRLEKLEIYYDPECNFCKKIALLLREFCLDPLVPVRPSSMDLEADALLHEHKSWVVRGADGQIYLKWDAVSYILKQGLLTWPVGWLTGLPLLRGAMNGFYDFIGRSRETLGAVTGPLLPWRTERAPPMWANFFCLILITVMVEYSFMALPNVAVLHMPPWLANTARILQIEQSWGIFAPNPKPMRRTVGLMAHFKDGTEQTVDKLIGRRVNIDRDTVDYHLTLRWRSYLANLTAGNDTTRQAFADYLCRTIDKKITDPSKQTKSITIMFAVSGLPYINNGEKFVAINTDYTCYGTPPVSPAIPPQNVVPPLSTAPPAPQQTLPYTPAVNTSIQ